MQFRILVKITVILMLSLLLWIPLAMISSLIGERKALRDGVLHDIAQESVDAQSIVGPVVIVPYRRRVTDSSTMMSDGKWVTTQRERIEEGRVAFLPDTLKIAGELAPEERHRGIYKAMLYTTSLAVSGHVTVPAGLGLKQPLTDYELGQPRLVFGIGDPRGIGGGLQLDWHGRKLDFMPGADAPGFGGGVGAVLDDVGMAGGSFDFAFNVDLRGLQHIDFIPTGKDSLVTLRSTWPHPSFYGRYMPQSSVGEDGFNATWHTSFFSTNARQLYEQCIAGLSNQPCTSFNELAHGVSLYQPADLYQQLERSAKYGFLFIFLTFAAFFLHELLKRLAIHPIQYGLVGLALATFFLLVTSLGERIGFAASYAIASAGSIGLIGFYLCHVLRSVPRGLAFAGLLSALYGLLFLLVEAEENALLAGSLALFALIGLVMMATRKVDWYVLEPRLLPKAPS